MIVSCCSSSVLIVCYTECKFCSTLRGGKHLAFKIEIVAILKCFWQKLRLRRFWDRSSSHQVCSFVVCMRKRSENLLSDVVFQMNCCKVVRLGVSS